MVRSSEGESGETSTLQTFLIADIRDYTRFTQEQGDEAAARLATAFASTTRAGVDAYGGDVVELRGDEALAVFPSARQAIRAALALQAEFAEASTNPSLPLHVGIGIDAGEAVSVEGGYRGGALNLAARLCSIAGSGQVLVSETILGLARKIEGLAYGEWGYVQLKGFGEPVRVLQIGPAQADQEVKLTPGQEPGRSSQEGDEGQKQVLPTGGFVGSLPSTALVGREPELETAGAILEQVAGGTGQVLLLSGEPGSGKTRLAQEITVKLHQKSFLIAAGGCYEAKQSMPFYPFFEALAQLFTVSPPQVRKDIPRHWSQLVRLLPNQHLPTAPAIHGPEDQERLFWAVTGFVQAVAAISPVAFLLDDLHWCDSASLDLLLHLSRHTKTDRVLILGTYREADSGRQRQLAAALLDLNRQELVERVRVRSLTKSETSDLASTTLGERRVSDALVNVLFKHTEGNPFFIQQVVRVLEERGDVYEEEGVTTTHDLEMLEVPETVRSVIDERLSHLSEDTIDVLEKASVLGQKFSLPDLESLSDKAEVEIDEHLLEATKAGVVREAGPDSYSFDHGLTQQALYGRLPSRRRRQLHLLAGQFLERLTLSEREKRASEIAWHFLRADDKARALPHVLLAGDQARSVFAHGQAEQHYRQALGTAHAVRNGEIELQALERLGSVLRTQSRNEEALKEFEAAMDLATQVGTQEDEMRIMAQIGLTHAERGTTTEGIKRLETFLISASSSNPTSGLAALYAALSRLYIFGHRNQESLDAAELATGLSSTLGEESILAQADGRRGAALYSLGRIDEALRTLEGAKGLSERLGDQETVCRALHNISGCYMIRGDLGSARVQREHMLKIAQQIDDPGQIVFARSYLGLIDTYLGEWDRAEQLLRAAFQVANRLGANWYSSYAQIFLTYLEFHRGKPDWTSLKPLETAEPHDRAPFIQALLGETEILQGQPREAVHRLKPLAAAQDIGSCVLLTNLAWAQLVSGDAAALKTAMIAVVQAKKYKYALAFVDALRVRAMALSRNGSREKAEEDLLISISLAHSIPYPLAEARSLGELSHILTDKGDEEEGEKVRRRAIGIFEKLGAGFYLTALEAVSSTVDA